MARAVKLPAVADVGKVHAAPAVASEREIGDEARSAQSGTAAWARLGTRMSCANGSGPRGWLTWDGSVLSGKASCRYGRPSAS